MAHHVVELTVWDVLSSYYRPMKRPGGQFKEDQRFRVCLIPHAVFRFSVLSQGAADCSQFLFSGYFRGR